MRLRARRVPPNKRETAKRPPLTTPSSCATAAKPMETGRSFATPKYSWLKNKEAPENPGLPEPQILRDLLGFRFGGLRRGGIFAPAAFALLDARGLAAELAQVI